MEEFERIGYKNSIPILPLFAGFALSLILLIFTIVTKPDNYIVFIILFALLAVVSFVSFVIEKKRPAVVVFLSDKSVKISQGFTWKIIPFDDIDYVDYELDVFHKIDAVLLNVGNLTIKTKTRKWLVRNVESVRECYEKITKTMKNHVSEEERE